MNSLMYCMVLRGDVENVHILLMFYWLFIATVSDVYRLRHTILYLRSFKGVSLFTYSGSFCVAVILCTDVSIPSSSISSWLVDGKSLSGGCYYVFECFSVLWHFSVLWYWRFGCWKGIWLVKISSHSQGFDIVAYYIHVWSFQELIVGFRPITHRTLFTRHPTYLAELIHVSAPVRSLCSSDRHLLHQPRTNT